MAHHDQLLSDMLRYTVTVDPNLKLAQSTEHVRCLYNRHGLVQQTWISTRLP